MENKDMTVIEKKEHPVITQEKIISYLDSFGLTSQLEPKEKVQFITIAVTYQLDPFKREIYCIPYKGASGRKLSIITGYEVYLKRAERTADLAGWGVITTGNTKDGTLKAVITIHRKSWTQPFVHEVDFSEYDQKNNIWNSKPKTMIKKVATAQGFRLAFADEFGGMPYTADELPVEMTTIPESKAIPTAPERKSAQPTTEAPKTIPEATEAPQTAQGEVSKGLVIGYWPAKGKGPASFKVGDSDYLKTFDALVVETLLEHKASEKIVEVSWNIVEAKGYKNAMITGVSVQGE